MNQQADESQVADVLKTWRESISRRDLDTFIGLYDPDVTLFDFTPPWQITGAENVRNAWEMCLPYFPDEFVPEHDQLHIHVAGEVAIVHGVCHFVTSPPDHIVSQSWMRMTTGLRKVDGSWKIIHEHTSLPINPMDNKAWPIKDPDQLDVPDMSAGEES